MGDVLKRNIERVRKTSICRKQQILGKKKGTLNVPTKGFRDYINSTWKAESQYFATLQAR